MLRLVAKRILIGDEFVELTDKLISQVEADFKDIVIELNDDIIDIKNPSKRTRTLEPLGNNQFISEYNWSRYDLAYKECPDVRISMIGYKFVGIVIASIDETAEEINCKSLLKVNRWLRKLKKTSRLSGKWVCILQDYDEV